MRVYSNRHQTQPGTIKYLSAKMVGQHVVGKAILDHQVLDRLRLSFGFHLVSTVCYVKLAKYWDGYIVCGREGHWDGWYWVSAVRSSATPHALLTVENCLYLVL
jgi:hypothetical protein